MCADWVRNQPPLRGIHRVSPHRGETRTIQCDQAPPRDYFAGVGTVSMRPSEWMIVLVPLPFGTMIEEPPPGVVVV